MKEIYLIDIPKEVYSIISNDVTQVVTRNMTKDELKAYNFGVTTTLSVLSKYYQLNKNSILINKEDQLNQTEIIIEDFIESLIKD